MNIELLADGGKFSLPTPVAEGDLGYDIALVPGLAAVWELLGFRGGPPGVAPGRGILGHPSAPNFAASLFLQYKRPEELRGRTAKEVAAREAAGAVRSLPYLRYELERQQLLRLADLHREAGPLAEVCYAAAAFTSRDRLQELQAWRAVLGSSNFLSLGQVVGALGASMYKGGHVWTYVDRENGDGVLCSEPTKVESYSGLDLLLGMAEKFGEERFDLNEHLFYLAEVLQTWSARHAGSTSGARDQWPLLMQMPGVVRAALSIESTAKRHGLGWFLGFPVNGGASA